MAADSAPRTSVEDTRARVLDAVSDSRRAAVADMRDTVSRVKKRIAQGNLDPEMVGVLDTMAAFVGLMADTMEDALRFDIAGAAMRESNLNLHGRVMRKQRMSRIFRRSERVEDVCNRASTRVLPILQSVLSGSYVASCAARRLHAIATRAKRELRREL